MTDRELRKLAIYIVDEMSSRHENAGGVGEDYIFMNDICRLTGLKPQTIYHHRKDMPLERHGGKLCSKRSVIMEWMKRRQ